MTDATNSPGPNPKFRHGKRTLKRQECCRVQPRLLRIEALALAAMLGFSPGCAPSSPDRVPLASTVAQPARGEPEAWNDPREDFASLERRSASCRSEVLVKATAGSSRGRRRVVE